MLSIALPLLAQTPEFHFTADGKLVTPLAPLSPVADKLVVFVEDYAKFYFSRQPGKDEYNLDKTENKNPFHLSGDDITAARIKLAGRINLSLDNLKNHPFVDSFYRSGFGNHYIGTVDELTKLSDELIGPGVISDARYIYLKELCHLENDLHTAFNPFSAKAKFNSRKKRYEIDVSRDDRLKSLVLTYLSSLTSALELTKLQFNNAYKESWRKIHELALRGLKYDSLMKDSTVIVWTTERTSRI